jgi:conjugal transfer ATP-binding protein TraC
VELPVVEKTEKSQSLLSLRWERLLDRDRMNGYFPWLAFDPKTQLFLLEGGYLGAFYEASVMAGAPESLVQELNAAISQDFPADTVIQVIQMNVPELSKHLEPYAQARAGLREDQTLPEDQKATLLGASDEAVSFFKDKETGRVHAFSDSHVPFTESRLYVAVKVPAAETPTQKQIDSVIDRLQAFEGAARSIHLKRANAGQLLSVVRRFFHIDRADDERVVPDTLLRDQVLYAGDGVEVIPGGARLVYEEQEKAVAVLSVKYFPETTHLGGMNHVIGDPLGVRTQFTEPYALVWTIHIPDQIDKRRGVERRSTAVNYQSFGPLVRWVPKLALHKNGIDALIERINQGDRIVECGLTVILWAEDEQAATKAAALMIGYLASIKFNLARDRFLGFVQFLNALPLFASKESIGLTRRYQTMSALQSVHLMPVLGDWAGQIASHQLNPVCTPGAGTLLISRRGHPVWADPFATTGNYNFVVAGDAGSGKTFFANQVVLDQLETGAQVWVIEIGRGFEKLCKNVGGDHIRFSDASEFGMNPFTTVGELEEELSTLASLIGAMIDPSPDITQRTGLSPADMSIVTNAIRAVWGAKARAATPHDVREFLLAQDSNERAQEMGLMMSEFGQDGAYGRWFNKPMDVDLTGRFVVLELDELASRKHLQLVVLLQFMFAIQKEMREGSTSDPRRRMLFVDEASELLKIKPAAEFLEGAYRRVRKLRGSIGVGIQRVLDLYANEYTKVLASQSESFYLLKQRQETIKQLQDNGHLAFDQYGYTMLGSLRRTNEYSEIMVYQDNMVGVGRLSVDAYRQVLFSSSGDAREVILAEIARGVAPDAAIRAFLARQNAPQQGEAA